MLILWEDFTTSSSNEEFAEHKENTGQFYQCSTCSFYLGKLRAQLFCAYILGLYFTGTRLLGQKLRIERGWN